MILSTLVKMHKGVSLYNKHFTTKLLKFLKTHQIGLWLIHILFPANIYNHQMQSHHI